MKWVAKHVYWNCEFEQNIYKAKNARILSIFREVNDMVIFLLKRRGWLLVVRVWAEAFRLISLSRANPSQSLLLLLSLRGGDHQEYMYVQEVVTLQKKISNLFASEIEVYTIY